MRSFGISFVALALLLAACGTTPTDRGLTGAAIGAGIGTAAGFAFGAPLIGAAAGALAGGAVGAVTTPAQVDLGKPVWE